MPSATCPLVTIISLRDLLRHAISRFNKAKLFFGHGFPSAPEEASYLISYALNLHPNKINLLLNRRLSSREKNLALQMIEQRIKQRCPAAYLTREAWLGNYKFYVDKRVIVPRSFIAELLQEHLSPWISHPEKIKNVLDLCTGSGCLAILAALVFPQAKIDASDISKDALNVAKRNIADYKLSNRVKSVRSNLFKSLTKKRYDLILANPPYVNAASMRSLPTEYRREPKLALAGGKEGLNLIHTIIQEARSHLTKQGLLIVEIGHNKKTLERAYPKLAFNWLSVSAGDEYVFMLNQDQLP